MPYYSSSFSLKPKVIVHCSLASRLVCHINEINFCNISSFSLELPGFFKLGCYKLGIIVHTLTLM